MTTLGQSGHLDHALFLSTVDLLADLVSAPEVAARWEEESRLPGMTIGGLTRHLVSQPECAAAFLQIGPLPPETTTLSLAEYFDRVDWLTAAVDDPENTSIRDDFNQLGEAGPDDSVAVLNRARADLPEALAAAGTATYVPWQDCALDRDDFLVVRLLEIVVHADDLAQSIGRPTPQFDAGVLEPVVSLLAALSLRRHGQDAVVRALARSERVTGPVSAF